MIEAIVEGFGVLIEFFIEGFFASIGLVIRKIFFFKKPWKELSKHRTWNNIVGALVLGGGLFTIILLYVYH